MGLWAGVRRRFARGFPALLSTFYRPTALFRPSAETGELGFEPRQTDPESVVLPLHHSPKTLAQDKRRKIEVKIKALRRAAPCGPGGHFFACSLLI